MKKEVLGFNSVGISKGKPQSLPDLKVKEVAPVPSALPTRIAPGDIVYNARKGYWALIPLAYNRLRQPEPGTQNVVVISVDNPSKHTTTVPGAIITARETDLIKAADPLYIVNE